MPKKRLKRNKLEPLALELYLSIGYAKDQVVTPWTYTRNALHDKFRSGNYLENTVRITGLNLGENMYAQAPSTVIGSPAGSGNSRTASEAHHSLKNSRNILLSDSEKW